MINLELRRIYKGENYTIGKLFVEGIYFCDTLEDTDRDLHEVMDLDLIKMKKIPGKTAIPSGTYQVKLTYSPKFKRTLPLIKGVKGFSGIRIHPGNDENDTEGCILVGENLIKGKVINSRKIFKTLMEVLKLEDEISITIR